MADFNQPQNQSYALLVIDILRAQIASIAKMFIGTSDTNIPDDAVRYNTDDDHFERKAGAVWNALPFHAEYENHIADESLHVGFRSGDIKTIAYASPDAGWVLCDGAAYSRTDPTYAALYAKIGTTYGAGDGSTTFNVPNCKGRFILCRDTAGSYQTLGQKGGALDHTHSTPNHTHTIAPHAHDLSNHTHSTPNHTHTIDPHAHTVNAHSHSAEYPGATLYVDASAGKHNHNINRRAGAGTTSGDNRMAMPGASGSEDYVLTRNDNQGRHGHPHSSVKGVVGNPAYDGEIPQATSVTSLSANSGGAGTSGAPSVNATGSSGILGTTAGKGAGVMGTANPSYIIFNVVIKL